MPATDPLTQRQILLLIAAGVAFWLGAALLCRALAPMGVYEGNARLLLYALVIPGTLPVVFVIRAVGRLARPQSFAGMAVATMAAMLCDGVALAWFPGLYGAEVAHIAGAGAVILWGAGVGLVLGWVLSR